MKVRAPYRFAAAVFAVALLSGCSAGGNTAANGTPESGGVVAAAETVTEAADSDEPADAGESEDASDGQTATATPVSEASQGEPVLAKTEGPLQVFEGSAPAGAENAVSLIATPDDRIGTYVADHDGFTLYRFDRDTTNPPASNCSGECEETWPRVLLTWPASVYVEGVDPSIVSYIELENGDCQLTINNWPVYYFVNDRAAGDVNGQGIGDVWFAIAPTGGKAQAS